MQIIRSIAEMQTRSLALQREGCRIGFVPTMGALHAGHLSLVSLARERSGIVVLSLFVNPTQFGPGEDFSRYPRVFEQDAELCRAAGVDILFAPEAAEMYAADHSVFVEETRLSRGLCGAARPGHFRGVATVVAKLLNVVRPQVAVFGQKDAQQVRVIRRLVRDLNFPVEIVEGAIIREADGLAMSSRNAYLNPDERCQARVLKQALDRGVACLRAGTRDVPVLKAEMERVIRSVPGPVVEYVEIVDGTTLEPVGRVDQPCLAALAVRIGRTRLIDNAVLVP